MKRSHKAVILGCLTAGACAAARRAWVFQMPLKEFTRYALYMAVLDDEICRNELEGNRIGDKVITFPPRAESLQERYHLFLQMNRRKSRRQRLATKENGGRHIRLWQQAQRYAVIE